MSYMYNLSNESALSLHTTCYTAVDELNYKNFAHFCEASCSREVFDATELASSTMVEMMKEITIDYSLRFNGNFTCCYTILIETLPLIWMKFKSQKRYMRRKSRSPGSPRRTGRVFRAFKLSASLRSLCLKIPIKLLDHWKNPAIEWGASCKLGCGVCVRLDEFVSPPLLVSTEHVNTAASDLVLNVRWAFNQYYPGTNILCSMHAYMPYIYGSSFDVFRCILESTGNSCCGVLGKPPQSNYTRCGRITTPTCSLASVTSICKQS